VLDEIFHHQLDLLAARIVSNIHTYNSLLRLKVIKHNTHKITQFVMMPIQRLGYLMGRELDALFISQLY
jgi:hypothetical protein